MRVTHDGGSAWRSGGIRSWEGGDAHVRVQEGGIEEGELALDVLAATWIRNRETWCDGRWMGTCPRLPVGKILEMCADCSGCARAFPCGSACMRVKRACVHNQSEGETKRTRTSISLCVCLCVQAESEAGGVGGDVSRVRKVQATLLGVAHVAMRAWDAWTTSDACSGVSGACLLDREVGQVVGRHGMGFAARTRDAEAAVVASGLRHGDLVRRLVCFGGAEYVVTNVRRRIYAMRCAGWQKERAKKDGAAHGNGGAVVGGDGRYVVCATYDAEQDEGRAIKTVEDLLDVLR